MKYLKKQITPYYTKHPKLNSSNAIMALINGYFWKSISGPFLSFIFPLIIVAILGTTVGYSNAFPGAFLLGIIVIGLNVLPATIADFKRSSLLKRISVTPISPKRILVCICGFYFMIMLLSTIFITAFTILLFVNHWSAGESFRITNSDGTMITVTMPPLSKIFASVYWGGYIYSVIMTILLSLTTGLMFASLFKTPATIQSVSVMMMIIVILSSGLAIPNQLTRSSGLIWYGGYITPFKPIINTSFESWNGKYKIVWPFDNPPADWQNFTNLYGSNPFNFTQSYSIYATLAMPGSGDVGPKTLLGVPEKMTTLILPFVWAVLETIVIAKKFRWTNR